MSRRPHVFSLTGMKIWCRICAACLMAAAWTASAAQAEWREFLGPRGSGVVADAIRRTWTPTEGISWKAEVPGKGASSPIVVGDLVVVTASSGARQDRLHVIAYDAATGARRWERIFWATGRTFCHPTSAASSRRATSSRSTSTGGCSGSGTSPSSTRGPATTSAWARARG